MRADHEDETNRASGGQPVHPALMFRIDQIQAFVYLAQGTTYSSTAEMLNMSEGGLHYQIRALEKLLGVRLFQRIGRQVRLTPTGEQLLPHALQVLWSASQLTTAAQQGNSRLLRIAAGPIAGPFILAPLLDELRALLDREIETLVTGAASSWRALVTGDVSAVVAGAAAIESGGRHQTAGIHAIPIGTSPWVPIISRRNPSHAAGESMFRRIVIPSEVEELHQHLLQAMLVNELPNVRIDVSDPVEGIFAIVRNEIALGMVPALALYTRLDSDSYEIVRNERLFLERTMIILYRADERLSHDEAARIAERIRSRMIEILGSYFSDVAPPTARKSGDGVQHPRTRSM